MMHHAGSNGKNPFADEQAPLDRALALAGQGIPVFPCNPDKTPKVRWREAATTEAAQIKRWWALWPDALPAVPTGRPSQIWVVDLDIDDETGEAVGEATMERIGLPPGRHPHRVITPSGGQHLYYRWDDDLPGNAVRVLPGVDLRGEGGYVIAWQPAALLSLGQLWEPPQTLLDAIRAARRKPEPEAVQRAFTIDAGSRGGWAATALAREIEQLRATPAGGRNDALNRAAFSLGQIVGGGHLDRAKVEAELRAAALATGLVAGEIEATVQSGLRAGMEHPRGPAEEGAPRGPTIIQPAPARESQFYSAASLKGKPVPPRQWLVHGLVPAKTVTLFSGDGGTGKSLLALQLAVAVAAQTAWIGKTVNTGRVIFLSAEDDDDELHRRLDDILTAEGRCYDDLSGLTLRSLAGEDALLAVDTQLALMQSALFKELDKRAAEEAPALIVIDTLADVYPANENDRAKVRQFVGILRGLAIKRKCAVLLLGHPSLTGLNSGTGTSGSTAWNNSVRSRLYLSRITDNGFEPDPDARVLSTKKANYGRTGGEISLKWKAGVFVAEAQPTGLDALAAGAKGERVFLKLLDNLTAQGRYVSASPGPTYAPTQLASHPEAEGCNKRALKSAMDTLFGRGEIVIASHGSGAKARSHIARKGADRGQE